MGNKARVTGFPACYPQFVNLLSRNDCGHGWKDTMMAGFLIACLFAAAAAFAIFILIHSGLRGFCAYRELSLQNICGEQYNSIVLTIAHFERWQAEPAFRMRHVTRASVLRPMVRRKAAALPVAA